jgi:hypothetical protein
MMQPSAALFNGNEISYSPNLANSGSAILIGEQLMNNHGAGFILDQFTIHRYPIHCVHQFAIHCVLEYTVTYWSKIPDTIHCVHQCNHPVYHSHFSERGYQGMLPIALIQRPEINWALGFDEGGVGHYFEQTGGDSAVPLFSSCLSTLSPRRCSHHFLIHDHILCMCTHGRNGADTWAGGRAELYTVAVPERGTGIAVSAIAVVPPLRRRRSSSAAGGCWTGGGAAEHDAVPI